MRRLNDVTPKEWDESFYQMFPKYVLFNKGNEAMWDGQVPKETADYKQVSGDHYVRLAMQPWEVMEALLTPEEFRGFLKGNIIKYGIRQGRKEGSDDGNKARHYKQKLQEYEKG